MKREVKKLLMRSGLLALIFGLALIAYFISSLKRVEKSNQAAAALSTSELPLAQVELDGRKMNILYPYRARMGNQVARECLTLLPEDRQLVLDIDEGQRSIQAASYEIRSLDLSQLIEKETELPLERASGGGLQLKLPIQNLIEAGREYLLELSLNTGEQDLYYYTRIVWGSGDKPKAMLQLAEDFSRKSFDYEQAKELTTYLETSDSADNSNLAKLSLKSNFSQLTWGKTGMKMEGEPQICLREFQGDMAAVAVSYLSSRSNEAGTQEYYFTEDNYIMRYDAQRIYLMNFERDTHQQFMADSADFQKNTINLGIRDGGSIQTKSSESAQFVAFKTEGGLWRYDQESNHILNLFSYGFDAKAPFRSNPQQHDIKILSCRDNGDVDFLVYGYMSRGRYEGYMGVEFYSYDNSAHTLTESFFIPMEQSYDKIRRDVLKLSALSDKGMMYLYYSGSFYGIDVTSLEWLKLADQISLNDLACSRSNDKLAWLEHKDGQDKISILELKDDITREITEPNEKLSVIGFMGDDFIYGIDAESTQEEVLKLGSTPLKRLKIVDDKLQTLSEYEKEGKYLGNISLEGNRIHLDLLDRQGDESYELSGSDTIIARQKLENQNLQHIQTANDEKKGKIYQLTLQKHMESAPQQDSVEQVIYENSSALNLTAQQGERQMSGFDSYALGKYLGSSTQLGTAIRLSYDEQGYVVDSHQRLVWNRNDRKSAVNMKDALTLAEPLLQYADKAENVISTDEYSLYYITGVSVNAVLYYLDKGMPALAYLQDGGYVLLSGYDQFNVSLTEPDSGAVRLMGRNDAESYFSAQGSKYLVALPRGE